jgi:hypothetical protein
MIMYFHGSNSVTRWAYSDDGIKFGYGGVAVTNAMGGSAVTETSYARVFRHPDPNSRYNYGMFYMGNERTNVSSADLWEWKGQHYVIYHASSGKAYARTIDRTLRKVGQRPIVLFEGRGDSSGNRVASPVVVTRNGLTYLFYEKGDRLGATIAWAKMAAQ